jgi:hypothetical protein
MPLWQGSYFALPELLGNYCTLAGYFANKDDYVGLLAYHSWVFICFVCANIIWYKLYMSYDILLTDFNLRINDKMMDGINTVYTVTGVYRL